MAFNIKKSIRSVVVAILSFSILFFIAYRFTQYKKGQWEKDVRNGVLEVLIGKKSKIEQALYSRIYYTKGVASYVSLNPTISSNEFDLLARDLIKNDSIIGSMSLAKGCVINAIYPQEGHQAAIGLDLLAHSERREIVEKTIETRKTFVAGPVELVEGGVAFISYTPIFDKTENREGDFWGVTDIVVLMEALFSEADLFLEEKGFEFSLRGYNGTGIQGPVFFGSEAVFENDPVLIEINLPYGNWVLAATPKVGWEYYYDQDKFLSLALLISSLIISILIGLVFHGVYKVRASERKLKAIFDSLDSLIIEFNSKGLYKSVASSNQSLLILPANKLIGKNVTEVFNPEIAIVFNQAIEKCIASKNLVIIEYPLFVSNLEKWFQGRISYRNDDSVIFNAIDITMSKASEALLKKSELDLKESNAMKDKLFSVLAHDLRNPLGNFMKMTELMVNDFNDFSEDELKEYLNLMKTSSKEVNYLLERIIEWQVMQQENSVTDFENKNIKRICEDVITQHSFADNSKGIRVNNLIPDNSIALCNERFMNTIFRNLLSNAIKFSQENGEVTISSEPSFDGDKEYLMIKVQDDGVGMKQAKIDALNTKGVVSSSLGTNKEKGTGLGLVLCREFIEMQGGKMLVESEENKGSTFSFTLKI